MRIAPVDNLALGAFIASRRLAKKISQAQLAQLAGVSNKTIVDYERGNLSKNEERQYHTLVRLALVLHDEPSDWLRRAGFQYDIDIVEQIAEQTSLRMRSESKIATTNSCSRNSLEELRIARTPIIQVAFIEGRHEDFYKKHMQLLCRFINCNWEIRFHRFDTHLEYLNSVITDNSETRCHVGIGALETPARIARGLRFINYPGFERHLGAVWCPPHTSSYTLSWTDLYECQRSILAITIKDEAGDQHLRSVCGYKDAEVIKTVERPSADELTRVFIEETNKHRNRPVVLCAVESRCQQVIKNLPHGYVSRSLESGAVEASLHSSLEHRYSPKYRVGFFVRHDDTEWGDLLSKTQEVALRDAPYKLAKLYAEMLAIIVARYSEDDPCLTKVFNRRLINSPAFLEYLSSELEQALIKQLPEGTDCKAKVVSILGNTAPPPGQLLEELLSLLQIIAPNIKNLAPRIQAVLETFADISPAEPAAVPIENKRTVPSRRSSGARLG